MMKEAQTLKEWIHDIILLLYLPPQYFLLRGVPPPYLKVSLTLILSGKQREE